MFIGREREMAELERRYRQAGFGFPVIYGRRRVGKTRLLQEFIKGKRAVYFMATEQGEREQRHAFSMALREQLPETQLAGDFASWDDLFRYVTELARTQRLVLVIDEFPYLAKAVTGIASLLQKYIDHVWQDTQLFLILCGSSMSFMERQVLGYKSPLYGRRTAQLKLHPLPYYESVRFFPTWPDEERLMAYGICGGIPQYLAFFSRYGSLQEAVCEEFLSLGGHLQEEPENLMLQELREPALYNSILTAVAHGASRQNDIATAVGRTGSQITFYLNNLQSLELLTRQVPVESKNSRKAIYVIADNLYRFWYRFMPECATLIAMGMGERAWQARIAPQLSEYFGHVFEDIAMQYVQAQVRQGTIPELYTTYGHWWGNNPRQKREEEIDLVCTNETDILCGECKWRNEPVGLPVLTTLQERAALIQRQRRLHLMLFAKSSFTLELQQAAAEKEIQLVTLRDLLALC